MVWTLAGLTPLVFAIAISPVQSGGGVTEQPAGAARDAQSTNAERPVFEVASIKPGDPVVTRFFVGTLPGRFMATNVTLKALIAFGLDMREEQISGGSTWVDSDRFTVEAKHATVTGGPGELSQVRLMLQSMLEDRFKLQVHRETRIEPIYELVTAPGRPKLEATTAAASGRRGIGTVGQGNVTGTAAAMPVLATFLGGVLGRRVIDRTGLPGTYDFTLTYAPAPWEKGPPITPPIETTPEPDPSRPSIFSAIQEQLGLRLEATRGPVDIVVLDRAEKPTEN
jgi:uncharacterized protein (TIGR03435 family)